MCGNEILRGKTITDEDGLKYSETSRYEITVNSAGEPNPEKDQLNESRDILCIDCVRKWRWTE
jgi:hypothetical protein